MESQLHRPTTHEHHCYDEDPHLNAPYKSMMEGEGEAEHYHHGEKKSVLKKVKDKAKKIKDKIKHRGHAHDEEDYDDEDEETVVASDLHPAPMNEEAFISGTNLPKQTGLSLGTQTTPLEDLQNPTVIASAGVTDFHSPNTREEVHPGLSLGTQTTPLEDLQNPTVIGSAGATDFHSPNTRKEVPVSNYRTSSPMDEDTYNPSIMRDQVYSGVGNVDSGTGKMGRLPLDAPATDLPDPLPTSTAVIDSEPRANVAEPMVKIGPLADLEKDPHGPGAISPPNYQTKVVDPTGKGGAEAEVAPLVERLGNLHVDDKPKERSYTGSHDQFSPEPTPIEEEFGLEPELEPKSFDADRPEAMPRDTVAGKISDATSVIADKASSAKNVVASKLGYGSSQSEERLETSKPTVLESVSEYGHKVAEKLAPVYGKAAGAGSAIMSKVQGEGGVARDGGDKGVSVQEYFAEKFSPGEEDKELSKVIADAINRKKERAPETGEDHQVKETIRIEAVASDEKAAAGVVDRVKGAIGSWLGKSPGEGLDKEEVSRVIEKGN